MFLVLVLVLVELDRVVADTDIGQRRIKGGTARLITNRRPRAAQLKSWSGSAAPLTHSAPRCDRSRLHASHNAIPALT